MVCEWVLVVVAGRVLLEGASGFFSVNLISFYLRGLPDQLC